MPLASLRISVEEPTAAGSRGRDCRFPAGGKPAPSVALAAVAVFLLAPLTGARILNSQGSTAQKLAAAPGANNRGQVGANLVFAPRAIIKIAPTERLTRNPNNLTALKSLATLSADRNRCPERIAYARQALELAPGDPALELSLARSLALCAQYGESVARYRRLLQIQPQTEGMLAELGGTLLRAGRNDEAIPVFRKALQLNPKDSGATLGLAQALAATGSYAEALLRYDEVLRISPQNYDALQGKAYVLYWTHQFAQARAIFQGLHDTNPNDLQNVEALADIARAEEEACSAASRPSPDASPRDFLAYYEKRLASYPNDRSAMKGMAYAQAQLRDFGAAIETYKKVLEIYPEDRDSKLELARLLSWNHQYDDSIRLYREVLKNTPDDAGILERLARVYTWSSHLPETLQIYQHLLAKNSSNTDYQLEAARLQLKLKDYAAAHELLTSLLATNAQNREARFELAQLELKHGHFESSLKQFDQLLKQNSNDFDALFGKAQISYYLGDLRQAHVIATTLVKEQPHNFDAIFLLASIERARRNRQAALALLDRATRLSPSNPEVEAMEKRVREEATVTVHTSASFAREISQPGQAGNQAASSREDLRAFSYGTTLEIALLPRTDSSLSLNYLPSNSPFGGIGGAVGPAEFLYRQTTRFSPGLMLRGAAGLVRFGPGEPQNLPGQSEPVPTATIRPIGYVGLSLFPTKKISFDLALARSAITYTPTSVRFGVMESRMDGRVNFLFNARTELRLDYFYGRYSSKQFDHCLATDQKSVEGKACHDQVHGGSVVFSRNLIRYNHFSFDAGYAGLAYAYEGRRRNVYLGFFNPKFYQRHLVTTRFYGNLRGPVGYDFSGGIGLQQIAPHQALTRALIVSPALTLRATSRFSLTLGYTHYNFGQTLGTLSGNAVRLSTGWKF